MRYTQPRYATLRGVKYAISVFEAIAENNELPPAGVPIVLLDRPGNIMVSRPPIPVSSIAEEMNVKVVNQVCKGATAYHLLKKSTVPPSMRYVSCLFNMTEDELWKCVKQLEDLQYLHNCIEYERLNHEYRQRIIAEERAKELAAKLAMSTEDRMAVIKKQLMDMADEGDFRNPNGIDLEELNDASCRLICIFEHYQNPTVTVNSIAELAGISSSRIRQIVNKLIRRWRHPSCYGGIFDIHLSGGPRSKNSTLYLVNLHRIDEAGNPVMDEYPNLTFGECIAKINTFLKQFDESIRLPLWA